MNLPASRRFLLACTLLGGCASSQRPLPLAAPPGRAAFDVAVPEPGQPLPSPSPLGTRTRPTCLYSAHFRGAVIPGQNDARILLTHAFVDVERHNDKELDALTLRLEVAEPGHTLGGGSAVEYLLRPTVDSAGPSVTSWQPTDTVRLLVPWPAGSAQRWLLFFLDYQTVSHDGTMSGCSSILKSDVLRFEPDGRP